MGDVLDTPQTLALIATHLERVVQLVSTANVDELYMLLDRFGDNPALLDGTLKKYVPQLAQKYFDNANMGITSLNDLVDTLYKLSALRGAKNVAKYLPTDALLLTSVLRLVSGTNAGTLSWKSRYVLLLWISTLLLTPIKLEALGNGLFDQILDLCKRYLVSNSKEQDAAVLVAARLITRRDSPTDAQTFLAWIQSLLPSPSTFASVGLLKVLNKMLKSKLWFSEQVAEIAEQLLESRSDVVVNLAYKVLGKVAFGSPYQLETVIGHLFEGVGHRSSAVRYTCAKMVGRVVYKAHAQNLESAESEIVGAVLELFQTNLADGPLPGNLRNVSESQWHGGLLCIAEIFRAGSEIDFEQLAPVIENGLHFEQRGTNSATGANVRDAATYVCWSMFRSPVGVSLSQLRDVYASLLGLACFDKEVNIRRAAAAALQEGLGRKKGLPVDATMALIGAVNFQSVSSIATCYLDICPGLETPPKLEYLMIHGVMAMESDTRRLAARCLSLMEPKYGYKQLVDILLAVYSEGDVDTQHGALLGLARIWNGSYRDQELCNTLEAISSFTSELVCEAVIAICARLPPSPSSLGLLSLCFKNTGKYVQHETRTTVAILNHQITDVVASNWLDLVSESSTFALALSSCDVGQKYLDQLARAKDPQSRKFAIEGLRPDSDAVGRLLIEALADYQTDKRGDVGSWVREAAIEQTVNLWSVLDTKDRAKAVNHLWRMSVEGLGKLRGQSSRALQTLQNSRLSADPAKYFADALEQSGPSEAVVEGIVKTIGTRTGSADVKGAALKGVSLFLSQHSNESSALFANILLGQGVGVAGTRVLRTLLQLCELGHAAEFASAAIEFATRMGLVKERTTEKALLAVQVLSYFTPQSVDSLARFTGHPSPAVRSLAADMLYEAGIAPDVLLYTEWSGDEYAGASRELRGLLT